MTGFVNWIRYLHAANLTLSTCWAVLPKLLYKPKPGKSQYLRDEDGGIVIYRGVNISNYSKHSGQPNAQAQHPWQTRDDMDKIPEWGFNFVRYLIFWEAIEPTQGTFDETYLTGALNRCAYLEKHNVDVVLDIHQDLFAQKLSGNGFPEWAIRDGGKKFKRREPWSANYLEPAVMNSFKNFWESTDMQDAYIRMIEHVIDKAESIPNIVGIDVMNEPWPKFPPMPFEKNYLTPFYEKVQAMMARKGTRLKLFFEPWMSTSAGIPTNLRFNPTHPAVFFPHFYDAFCESGRKYESWNKKVLERAVEIKVREAQEFGVPIAFGEFGYPGYIKNPIQGLNDFLDLADKYTFGWTYYTYDIQTHSDRGILLPDKSESPFLKALMRPYPQRIAGTDPVFSYKGNKFRLRYNLDPNAHGNTVVYVPKDKTYTVACSGMHEVVGQYVIHENSSDSVQYLDLDFQI